MHILKEVYIIILKKNFVFPSFTKNIIIISNNSFEIFIVEREGCCFVLNFSAVYVKRVAMHCFFQVRCFCSQFVKLFGPGSLFDTNFKKYESVGFYINLHNWITIYIFYHTLQNCWYKNNTTYVWTKNQWNVICRLGLIDQSAQTYTLHNSPLIIFSDSNHNQPSSL